MRTLPPGFVRLASGRIRWRVQVNGRRVTGTAETLSEAKHARAQAQISSGGDTIEAPSVGELVDLHLDQADVAPLTDEANRRVAKHLTETFRARNVSTVTPVHVTALWRELGAAGVEVSGMHRLGGVCSKAWQRAATLGWATSNPFQLSPAPTPPQADEVDPPSIDDVRRAIDHFDGHPMALMLRLGSVTGARRGELAALQWDDIRIGAGEVVIRRSLSEAHHEVHVGDTKTGRRGHRSIPLDTGTIRAIKQHARIVGCPWVFTHDGLAPWRPSYITRALARATTKLDLEFSFHGLRHFAATQWLSDGVPPSTVAGLLGHTSTTTLLRVYAHWIPAQGREVIASHAARLDA